MTVNEMLSRCYSAWAEETKSFIFSGTLTGGTVNTFIDTALTQEDDFFNNMEIEITSGSASGQRRQIVDWVKSTNTGTVASNFSASVSGATYRIGHKGFWSANTVLEYLTDAANDLKNYLLDDVFFRNLDTETTPGVAVSGKDYAETQFPPNIVRPIAVYVDGVKARVFDLAEARGFYRDPYISTAVLLGGADEQTAGYPVHYKPKVSTQINWVYIKETSVTVSDPSDIPSNLHTLLVDDAVARGFEKQQRADIAAIYRARYDKKVQALNLQVLGKIGLTK